jgi:hypothetical protein
MSITVGVSFPCGRKPEYPEKTHDFRQSVGFYSFRMRTGFESRWEASHWDLDLRPQKWKESALTTSPPKPPLSSRISQSRHKIVASLTQFILAGYQIKQYIHYNTWSYLFFCLSQSCFQVVHSKFKWHVGFWMRLVNRSHYITI